VITSLLQRTDMISPLQMETVSPYCKASLLTALPVTLHRLMEEPFGILTRRNHPLSPSALLMLRSLEEAAARIYPGSDVEPADEAAGSSGAAQAKRKRSRRTSAISS